MRSSLLAVLAAAAVSPLLALSFANFGSADGRGETRVTGPVVRDNLAVYFVHGKSTPGEVPLTLEEALLNGVVKVHETGSVNELEIENLGAQEVFVQSGDIVKGGQQDRALLVSQVLPPHSGRVAVASFCVEQGRWSGRTGEDAHTFATAAAVVPSREIKLAMKRPLDDSAARPLAHAEAASHERVTGHSRDNAFVNVLETSDRQQEVWNDVRNAQAKLSTSLGAQVSSNRSASSLQLALENEKLVAAQDAYVAALQPAGESEDDVIGYVFAVNGKLNSADLYPSNGLFRKMWLKLLRASAIEAIGHKDEPGADAPSVEAVRAFLADAERGAAREKPLNAGARLETREGETAYLFETERPAPVAQAAADAAADAPAAPPTAWVHRNYLAK
jgi:ARG/rhodanese/phosphatase superfamily protein